VTSHFLINHLKNSLEIIQSHIVCHRRAEDNDVFCIAQDEAAPLRLSKAVSAGAAELKSLGMRWTISPSLRNVSFSSA